MKLTHTAHGAHLSDARGYVTHEMLRGLDGWTLYRRTGAFSKRLVGKFDSLEAARAAAEMSSARRVVREAMGDLVKVPPRGAWLYHCTYYGRLPGILKAGGLAPRAGVGGQTFGGAYAARSRGKLFVSRSSRLSFWYNRLDLLAKHNFDAPELPDVDEWNRDDAEEQWKDGIRPWTVVVLRYRDPGRHPWSPEYREDIDHSDDYYWDDPKKKVPARYLAVWDPYDGGWWTRLDRNTISELGDSIDSLLDESLDEDPEGYGYQLAWNDRKLMSDAR